MNLIHLISFLTPITMADRQIILDGSSLTLGHIDRLISEPGVQVVLSQKNLAKVQASFDLVNKEQKERVTYGVNTGFGPMASYLLGRDQLVELQYNLLRSHAVGIGEPIEEKYVLASMVIRLNTLAKGFSGVSVELLESLKDLINNKIIPIIPEHGSVGTSGDLVQLAHIGLAVIGEGEVFYKGKRMQTAKALKLAGLKPHKLHPKEGLSLINGTSTMSGIAACNVITAQNLLKVAIQNGAFALEMVNGFQDSISKELHLTRPHPGQMSIAEDLRNLLVSSKRLRNRDEFAKSSVINHDVYQIPESVQEVYSLRCIPQILGPIRETIEEVAKVVEIEMNSVTDNPVVDTTKNTFLHGGNFHGDYIAVAMDRLKASIVKLTMLTERRINFFLNKNVNKTFPPFLNLNKPGLTLALQGLQFVATSTTADNQTLAFPHAIHSISTNGDNQDVVSMGTDAALFTSKVIENAYVVMAIEAVTLTQAMDIVDAKQEFSTPSQRFYETIRKVFPKVVEDRGLHTELTRVVEVIKTKSN